jgi:2-methylfumaryl-CoA isomerase
MSKCADVPTGVLVSITPSTPASASLWSPGPETVSTPVNHVLPAWDIACGIYAALAVMTALRHRGATGLGQRVLIPLENVALATTGNLGFLTEVMINGVSRERIGNSIYGQYGQQFTSLDGASFMIVALTSRHFRDLIELAGTTAAVDELAARLEADFGDEGQRYQHRDALTRLFSEWFSGRTAGEIVAALSSTSILWERYRTFAEVAQDEKVTSNALFTMLEQPRIGRHLAPGLPIAINGTYPGAVPAPAVGDHTAAVLRDRLGLSEGEIRRLLTEGTVA